MNGSKTPNLAFIFDLDGVLVHSMPLHTRAWEEYLAKLGIKIDDLEGRMHGKRNAELVGDLIANDLSDQEVFNHGAAKEKLWREMLLEEGVEKYAVRGLTEFLERHQEVPKAVASNAEPQNIDFVLDRYGLRRFFPIAVNGMDVERPKPFPDIYLEAARRLKVKPQDCLVFEDSPTGLEAGLAAGMRVIGIQTSPAELPGAALLVEDFSSPKLERWLEQNSFGGNGALLKSGMMFTGIEHFAIASPNPKRLAEWYVSTLDFEISYEYAGNYFVEAADGSLIEIIPAEGERPESAMRTPGMRHIAIAVHDFDGTRSELASRGAKLEGEPYENQGNRLQFFKDADGNLLHLIQREKPLPSSR